MQPLLERIRASEILVADGALGTMLLAEGLAAGKCPESFNLEHPEILERIARAYLDAGADIIQTNTFGASPLKLSQYHLDDLTEEINVSAVRAVRKAIGDRAYLSASIGPCGRLLEPYGDIDSDQVLAGFERQIKALASEGVDMLCIETMTDLAEATLAIKAVKSVLPAATVCATMTFDSTPRGFFTIMGVSVEQAAIGLAEAGADFIGSNCGNGIANMVTIADEFRKHTTLPLLIQSNAGLPEVIHGELVYHETPEYMASQCRKLLDIGVNIVGGCCGTTPAHIRAIRSVVDKFRSE